MAGDIGLLFRNLGERLAELQQGEIPDALGELERLRSTLFARLVACASTDHDELLDVEEAADRLAVSRDWIYRNAKRLPFAVRIGGHLRFSSKKIDRFIRQNSGAVE